LSEEKMTSGMVNDSGIIAKIQIVGTEETVKSVTEFMAAIGSATLDIMLERGTLIKRKSSIETLEKLRAKSENEVERYISIMKKINLEGNQRPSFMGYN
jgi:ATP-dependent RNA circularization protein (DNA/RNA ligase family)